MTKAILTLTLVFFYVSLMSCSSGKKEQAEMNEHDHMHEQPTDESVKAAGDADEVTEAYLALKDAFVATDAAKAAEVAKKLEEAFHNSNLHSEAEIAKSISQTDNVEEQRKIFKKLSERVYQLASEDKLAFNTLYKQYCPMAFNNTGAYWLSDSKAIRNPYFGDKMLKCGKVEETLAKK